MTHIEYSGIAPESIELINSDEFRAVLSAHPNLKVVTVEENEATGDEIFNEVTLPLSEDHEDYVAVMERDNDEAFMWVLYDDFEMVEDPSPAFIEILKVMDAFSVQTLNERLFSSAEQEVYVDSPEILTAMFDFRTGEYVL